MSTGDRRAGASGGAGGVGRARGGGGVGSGGGPPVDVAAVFFFIFEALAPSLSPMDLRAAATRISALLPSNFAEAADSPLVPAQLSYGGLAGVLTLGDTEELAADRCSECAKTKSRSARRVWSIAHPPE